MIDEAINAVAGLGLKYRLNGHESIRCQCPAHGGKDLNAIISWRNQWIAMCHSHSCSFAEILQPLGLYGMESKPLEPKRIVQKKKIRSARNTRNAQLLQEHISDAPYADKKKLEPYFLNRGLTCEVPDDLFFLERCSRSDTFYPAMFAYVRDVTGRIVSGHRTFIPDSKKFGTAWMMGAVVEGESSGCAIRLSSHESEEIFLTEGIETGLSILIMFKKRVPVVWSCISSGGLASIKLPVTYKKVNIFADRDLSGAGQKAAEKARIRLEAEGRQVVIVLPPEIPNGKKSYDWNDVLVEGMK